MNLIYSFIKFIKNLLHSRAHLDPQSVSLVTQRASLDRTDKKIKQIKKDLKSPAQCLEALMTGPDEPRVWGFKIPEQTNRLEREYIINHFKDLGWLRVEILYYKDLPESFYTLFSSGLVLILHEKAD